MNVGKLIRRWFVQNEPHKTVAQPVNVARSVSVDSVFQQLQHALYDNMDTMGGGQDFGYLVTVYIDAGELYALFNHEGLLQRALLQIDTNDVITLGALEEVSQQFTPTQRSSVTVQRMADGQHRITMIAATAILNRMGQIDSTALFDDMIQRANDYNFWPKIDFFHLGEDYPDAEFGQIDFLARDGVCYIASGLLDPNHPLTAPMVRALQTEPSEWGGSIEYYPLPESVDYIEIDSLVVPIFRQGLNTRISILPETEAAAWFTGIGFERRSMNKQQETALKKMLGEDEFNRRMASVVGVNDEVEKHKLIFRAVEPVAETPVTPEPETAPTVELDDKAVGAIVRSMAASGALTDVLSPITTAIASLSELIAEIKTALIQMDDATDTRLTSLEQTDEEKQREWVSDLPAQRNLKLTYRPREVNAGVVEELTLEQIAENGALTMRSARQQAA